MKKRLAIIGAGPSGLICLKFARESLPNWEIICLEKNSSWGGSWAKTHPEFLSTSTKYTTQFSCHQNFEIGQLSDPWDEFFKGNEYGRYLDDFVDSFNLSSHIQLNTSVDNLDRLPDGKWRLLIRDQSSESRQEDFSHIIFCTGLADQVKSVEADIPLLEDLSALDRIKEKTIVVLGGGESAVDAAERLARSEKANEVYLSLRSGIRVSPRVHPIRNVPSDYLRNRLMLSIHENIRNGVGQFFVEFRIKFEKLLRSVFPSRLKTESELKSTQDKKAFWNRKINDRAKGKLFNMFHNKSDDFLDAIAEDRIKVIGPNKDRSFRAFSDFDRTSEIDLEPDLLIPSIGFSSRLSDLTQGMVLLRDFYLGCIHCKFENTYAVGYTRPIIGNIPTISEVQAIYVISLIGNTEKRPQNIDRLLKAQTEDLRVRYPNIDIESVFPVDMFPYCDKLANLGGFAKEWRKGASLRSRIDYWLGPASTNQYFKNDRQTRIYTPGLLNFLLFLIKIFDFFYRKVARK